MVPLTAYSSAPGNRNPENDEARLNGSGVSKGSIACIAKGERGKFSGKQESNFPAFRAQRKVPQSDWFFFRFFDGFTYVF